MNANPSNQDIDRTVSRIREGWTGAERQWRRQVGELRRAELISMILKSPPAPQTAQAAAG